ncbi:hypothetical protein Ancab_005099 [Ancistrocladus abbreviatus]
MDLRHSSTTSFLPYSLSKIHRISSSMLLPISSSLPLPPEKAKYYRELQAAVDVVQRACHLCVNVQKSLFADDGRILEKSDRTPVTIADFGVQALVSLELSKLFPLVPLVAEEDSSFLRSNNLVDAVVTAVTDNSSLRSNQLTDVEVLEAIDRGGKISLAFGAKPATYWVGLALIVKGEIVLGVMGCPNWKENFCNKPTNTTVVQENEKSWLEPGIIMAAHVGFGTWVMRSSMPGGGTRTPSKWTRCFVDQSYLIQNAQFCIPDSQTWDSLPLSPSFEATTDANSIGDKQVLLLQTCCGSLCKYLMVALGRATVFILRAKAQTIIKAWDHAVGMICVHEAGGKVTDWKGSQLDLAADEAERRIIFPSGGVLVTNGNLHAQILELISANSTVL